MTGWFQRDMKGGGIFDADKPETVMVIFSAIWFFSP